MEITISPQEKKTEEKYFNNQNKWLNIEPFKSNIQGLAMCLQDASGLSKRIPISDTEKSLKENIGDFGYFWFEYLSTDKEYIITVNIANHS
jgi:hypothetical protein